MSDTPRTDAEMEMWNQRNTEFDIVGANFAKQLERELARCKADLELERSLIKGKNEAILKLVVKVGEMQSFLDETMAHINVLEGRKLRLDKYITL